MATESTSEEKLKARIAAMGEPLGSLFDALDGQVAWLHVKLRNFRTLYAQSKDRIGILNKIAPSFFHQLQETIHEAVLLHLCRITDRTQTGGHDNLTIQRFTGLLMTPERERQAATLIQDINSKVEFARRWRHLRLAHLDLNGMIGGPSRPVPPSSLGSIEDAISGIRTLMNYIHGQFQSGSIGYEHTIEGLGGVESFVSFLERFVDSD